MVSIWSLSGIVTFHRFTQGVTTSSTTQSHSGCVSCSSYRRVSRFSARNVVSFPPIGIQIFLRRFTQRPQRPLPPLNMPPVFSAPATKDARFPTHPYNGPPGQGVQPKNSAPVSQPRRRSLDRQERHVEQVVPHQNMATGYFGITPALPPMTSVASHELRPSSAAPLASRAARSPTHPHLHPVDVPPELPPLLKGEIVLPHRTICHSQRAQKQMEHFKIPWGVQYELARGVLAERWTWDAVTDRVLEKLQGSNAQAAPRVNAVMSGTVPRMDSGKRNLELW